ncbi:MAG: chromosomal replication initiator protein DnaA [Lachnospiraceae bacterium]|nr:chromosomal replication initiator protein DnaA [Lachnospiraceae bacterium]
MLELIQSKWNEILKTMQQEYDIANVSFNTWLLPLKVISVDNNIITILVPEDNTYGLQYIKKKYYNFFKVTIDEMFEDSFEIEFISPHQVGSIPTNNNEDNSLLVKKDNLNNRILEANLNPKYTFDTFVVGASNNFAHAYALAVAESPAQIANPLFIYGGVGLGKTHLMHAIANFILEKNENAKVLCVTSEVFTNELINAIRDDKQSAVNEFRQKYRNIDVLLVDDIQFIIGKERCQEEFFHTFNTLHEAKKQIIITSDKPPKEMKTLEERLRSRFEWGLTVDISSPDYETKMAILRKKSETEGYNIDDEILQYIASNIQSNIRELEGALTKIVAYSKISPQPVDVELAKEVLKDLISPDANRIITPELIIKIVAEHFNITQGDIESRKKSKEFAYPRQIAMYLCRILTEFSLDTIGSFMGRRDHSTILHGIEKIQKEVETSESTKNTIEVLKKKIMPD